MLGERSHKNSFLSRLLRLRLDVTANWVSHPCLVLSEAKSRKRHCCGLIISPACSLQLVSPFIELKNGHEPSSFIPHHPAPKCSACCLLGEAAQVQSEPQKPVRSLWDRRQGCGGLRGPHPRDLLKSALPARPGYSSWTPRVLRNIFVL